jgi:two-component system OmpR family response regulator
MPHILVVEDEPGTAGDILAALRAEGHRVTHVADGAAGIALAMREPFDAITLDRMMPGLDGVSFVRQLREQGHQAPVLMISAMGDVDDRIAGLRAGGDDYLVKPFSPAEMIARIEALLRRGGPSGGEPAMLHVGDLEIDLIRRTVRIDGEAVKLLHMEFRLLEYMMRNRGTIVTRRMIFEQVWGYHFDPGANLVNVHIARLRKKLVHPDAGFTIETIKGEGYRLDSL